MPRLPAECYLCWYQNYAYGEGSCVLLVLGRKSNKHGFGGFQRFNDDPNDALRPTRDSFPATSLLHGARFLQYNTYREAYHWEPQASTASPRSPVIKAGDADSYSPSHQLPELLLAQYTLQWRLSGRTYSVLSISYKTLYSIPLETTPSTYLRS